MVVEDMIRAKGMGVVLDDSIGEGKAAPPALSDGEPTTCDDLTIRYYRARLQSSRDGLYFSVVLNLILVIWTIWLMWRW